MSDEEFFKLSQHLGASKSERVGESLFAYGSHKVCSEILDSIPSGMVDFSPRYETWFVTTYKDRA